MNDPQDVDVSEQAPFAAGGERYRCRKILPLSLEALGCLLSGEVELVAPLPEGTWVRRVGWDDVRNVLLLSVEHPMFGGVRDGHVAPEITFYLRRKDGPPILYDATEPA